jgi:hypothetical protein
MVPRSWQSCLHSPRDLAPNEATFAIPRSHSAGANTIEVVSTVRDAALPTVDGEVGLADTIGILRQPWVRPFRSSAGRGWRGLYVSTQSEQPYQAIFEPADTPLAILHLGGPVVVEHGDSGGVERKTMPAGGFFLHPAGPERDVHLGGDLNTVHANLTVDQFEQAAQGSRVELAPTLRANDPMIEQLLMAMDGVLTNDVPTALTYVDHLTAMLAAHLTHRYNAVTATGYSPTSTVELSADDGQCPQHRPTATEFAEGMFSRDAPIGRGAQRARE